MSMDDLFCSQCNNLLNIQIDKSNEGGEKDEDAHNKLIYYCEKCDISEERTNDLSAVFHLNYNLDTIKRNHIVNKYTGEDITLPKATGIKCPNDNCPSKKKTEIRYIKYDDQNMKYIYMCISCNRAGIQPNIW